MRQYINRRLLLSILVLLGVSLLVFLVLHFMPVDPVRELLMQHQTGTAPTTEGTISDAQIAELRKQMGLDQPLYIQFARFVWNALHGDFGQSWRNKRAVITMIAKNAPDTIELSLAGLAISITLGVVLGTVAAVKQNTAFDTVSMILAVGGVCAPSFWLGLMLMMVFGLKLGWFPPIGSGTWRHLVLPAVTMGLGGAALVARLTRANMVEVLRMEYITTARSKGLSERIVVAKHALRNAMIPVVTVVGLSLGHMLGGSVIIENVFGRPGLGRIAVDAIWEKDYPVVQTTVLMMAISYVIANLLVDILYGTLDPRIRYS
ncbi:MAG: ABC transporter permease [Bacillota bacterium]|nr:ABC transporter permease [Bacillota bacterium]